MDPRELLLTAARALGVYLLMLVAIRALGKRSIGNLAAFDLLVALMLGEVVDEIIYGDVSFLQGTVVIVAIGAIESANSWLTCRSDAWGRLVEGSPTVIIRDGELQQAGMRTERINARDVMAQLRAEGIRDAREVHLAILEEDGRVSVIRQPWAEPAQKADVDEAASRQRKSVTDGKEPPPALRTDAPRWLT